MSQTHIHVLPSNSDYKQRQHTSARLATARPHLRFEFNKHTSIFTVDHCARYKCIYCTVLYCIPSIRCSTSRVSLDWIKLSAFSANRIQLTSQNIKKQMFS